MNPYTADPNYIPPTDLYADIPLYGRYLPNPDDFQVNAQHINSESPESIQYWTSVVELCNESVQIYPADDGGRDVLALGSVIVKSSHLHHTPEINYSYADANEICAISMARSTLKDIKLPEIYFAGKVLTSHTRMYIILTPLDPRPPGPSPGKTPGCYVRRCMAVPLAKSKGVI